MYIHVFEYTDKPTISWRSTHVYIIHKCTVTRKSTMYTTKTRKVQTYKTKDKLFSRGPCNVVFSNVKKPILNPF